jgi:hypothetical protein
MTDREKSKELYTQGNYDARDGFPMNRFLANDPDYKEGYEDFKRFMEQYTRIKRDSK